MQILNTAHYCKGRQTKNVSTDASEKKKRQQLSEKRCFCQIRNQEHTFLTKSFHQMRSLCTTVTNPLPCNLSVYMSNLSVSCRLSAACCLHTATRLTTSQGARLPDCQVNLTNFSLCTQLHVRLHLPSSSLYKSSSLHSVTNSKLLTT